MLLRYRLRYDPALTRIGKIRGCPEGRAGLGCVGTLTGVFRRRCQVIARVLRVDVSPEQVDAVVAAYRQDVRPIHAAADGLRQITCWLIARRAVLRSPAFGTPLRRCQKSRRRWNRRDSG